jgi:hypothetical protein
METSNEESEAILPKKEIKHIGNMNQEMDFDTKL